MFWVRKSLAPILSNAGWSEAAAKTVTGKATPHDVSMAHVVVPEPQTVMIPAARIATMVLVTGQLHADVGRLDHRDRRHSGLEVEVVDSLCRQQRYEPVRPGLDLHLGRDAILDYAGDDAGKPIARRLRDHDFRRLFPVGLRQPSQRGAVHQALAAGAARRAQAAVVDHAADRIGADPKHLRGLPEAIARHF